MGSILFFELLLENLVLALLTLELLAAQREIGWEICLITECKDFRGEIFLRQPKSAKLTSNNFGFTLDTHDFGSKCSNDGI